MAEGVRRDEWARTSEVLAMLHNANWAPPRPASAFNPLAEPTAKPAPMPKVSMETLKAIFVDRRLPQ